MTIQSESDVGEYKPQYSDEPEIQVDNSIVVSSKDQTNAMLTYLRDNFEEVWGIDPSTKDGFDQKLLALKVLLESQSNNSAIGIDIAVLRKEVTKLSNAKK